ncbi:MAG: hypothetical protein AB8B48_01990 [Pseudomonadales bacterium]
MKPNTIALCSLFLLTSCSGGGGDGAGGSSSTPPPTGNSGPAASITSPGSDMMASTATLDVIGTASDDDGVSSVSVNGISASSSDRFANWQAEVPLLEGMNSIVVATQDTLGNRNTQAAQVMIERGFLFDKAENIILDPERRNAILVDEVARVLMKIDAETRMRAEFSGPNAGTGPQWDMPVELLLDDESDRALVFDSGLNALVSVDLANGDRSIVASDSVGSGLSLAGASVFTLDPGLQQIYAITDDQLLSVDLANGDRQATALSGSDIDSPRTGRVDKPNNRLLVSAPSNIFAIDLSSGRSTPLMNP